ncbi:GGDEF domain-containing protein [Eubacterium limosum]|nr:GGDEF domain-containing protein [Eubacterium limosum]
MHLNFPLSTINFPLKNPRKTSGVFSYLHMHISVSVVGQDIEAAVFCQGGQGADGHAGAVEVGGGAAFVEGPGHAAHLLVARPTAHAGGDDDRRAHSLAQGLDAADELGVGFGGEAVTKALAVAAVLVPGEVLAHHEGLLLQDTAAYDDALAIIAEKQIKEEYREGYLSTFGPRQVLRDYELGIENLRYEFMITKDGQHYYWMRITARIFFWEEDQSVRMFVYRQNIDEEKKREQYMSEKMKRDSLTGLYHKVGTQEQIDRALAAQPEKTYAFFILDIDDFKDVNDTCGHAMGDLVISRFASVLKAQFREDDIVGRIGGDEFAAFVPVPSPEYARQKAESLVAALHISYKGGRQITASVGASLAPRDGHDFAALYQKADSALYDVKAQGKDGFKLY